MKATSSKVANLTTDSTRLQYERSDDRLYNEIRSKRQSRGLILTGKRALHMIKNKGKYTKL